MSGREAYLNQQYEVYVVETGKTLTGRTSEFQLMTLKSHEPAYNQILPPGFALDHESLFNNRPLIRVPKNSDVEKVAQLFGFEEGPK